MLGSVNNFYDYADEHDFGESEEDIMEWVKEHSSRGVIRYILASAPTMHAHNVPKIGGGNTAHLCSDKARVSSDKT